MTSTQTDLDAANGTLTSAQKQFCTDTTDYVTALDRYGKLFTDSKTTVGDVKTGGADLVAPKESVTTFPRPRSTRPRLDVDEGRTGLG